jgi:hypothetical protein
MRILPYFAIAIAGANVTLGFAQPGRAGASARESSTSLSTPIGSIDRLGDSVTFAPLVLPTGTVDLEGSLPILRTGRYSAILAFRGLTSPLLTTTPPT